MFQGNYYIYTRCSTEEQGKKGFSHQYQVATIKQHMKNMQGSELGIFSDTMTGTILERPHLRALYELCKASQGQAKYLIIQKFDRLGRNAEQCLKWVRLFREIGVEVNSPFEFIDFKTTDWPVMLSLRFAIAQTESIKISERTKDGINQALRSGYWTASTPLGYKRIYGKEVKSDGKARKVMVVDPKTAPMVRTIFERFLRGESRSEIKLDFKLSKHKFYHLFENTLLYAGFIQTKAYRNFKPELVNAKHKGIISFKEHEKIQNIIAEFNSTNSRSVYVMKEHNVDVFFLKGILRCNLTGRGMTGYFAKGRSKYYPYYHTAGAVKKRQYVKMELVHDATQRVLDELSIKLSDDKIAYVLDRIDQLIAPQIEAMDQQQKDIESIKDQLKKVKSDYLSSKLDVAEYKSFKSDLSTQINNLSSEIHQKQQQIRALNQKDRTALSRSLNIGKVYWKSDVYNKKNILRSVFPRGFSFVKGPKPLRTTYINNMFSIMNSNTDTYKGLDIKKGTDIAINPLGGRRWDLHQAIYFF